MPIPQTTIPWMMSLPSYSFEKIRDLGRAESRSNVLPFVRKTTSSVAADKVVPLIRRLADITKEDRPEALIEVIQNHALPTDERNLAMEELIRRFQFFIIKVVSAIWNAYYEKNPQVGYSREDLFQDAFLHFCFYASMDFKIKPKHDLGKGNFAVFGTYIKGKLYLRLKHEAQTRVPKHQAEGFDFSSMELFGFDDPSIYSATGNLRREVIAAMVANSINSEEIVIDDIQNEYHRELLTAMREIANEKLSERSRQIWNLFYFSGQRVEEIRQQFCGEKKGGMNSWSIYAIAERANQTILAELGRRDFVKRALRS